MQCWVPMLQIHQSPRRAATWASVTLSIKNMPHFKRPQAVAAGSLQEHVPKQWLEMANTTAQVHPHAMYSCSISTPVCSALNPTLCVPYSW